MEVEDFVRDFFLRKKMRHKVVVILRDTFDTHVGPPSKIHLNASIFSSYV